MVFVVFFFQSRFTRCNAFPWISCYSSTACHTSSTTSGSEPSDVYLRKPCRRKHGTSSPGLIWYSTTQSSTLAITYTLSVLSFPALIHSYTEETKSSDLENKSSRLKKKEDKARPDF